MCMGTHWYTGTHSYRQTVWKGVATGQARKEDAASLYWYTGAL